MDLAHFFRAETDFFTVPAGELIFREGAPADSMYVLLEGRAEVSIGGHAVEIAEAGALLGELALIDHRPRAATVLAITPCKLLPVDEARFHQLIAETPRFATHVMQVMAGRLRRVVGHLATDSLGAERP
jgi:CRP/FNR family cyclic AMP-dependent transcriptional regulator